MNIKESTFSGQRPAHCAVGIDPVLMMALNCSKLSPLINLIEGGDEQVEEQVVTSTAPARPSPFDHKKQGREPFKSNAAPLLLVTNCLGLYALMLKNQKIILKN